MFLNFLPVDVIPLFVQLHVSKLLTLRCNGISYFHRFTFNHTIGHHRVSQPPFGLRQILNLYTIYYQLSFAFYSLLCPLSPCSSSRSSYPLRGNILGLPSSTS